MPSTRREGDFGWYVGAVGVGAALIVAVAVAQPYNQNELVQIAPYGSNDISSITHGTRQPPLDPLLGALVQHLLGEGQLRQRLVPVLAGIGTLVVLGLLLRRLGLGYAGAFSLWFLALQPVMVQYSAYTRPYALPVFLSVVFVYAAQRWMEDRRPAWLIVAIGSACALPLSRVPEPNVFLLASAATLAWFSLRGRRPWAQTGPLIGTALAAVAFIGYPLYRSLSSSSAPRLDLSPDAIAGRFPAGAKEVLTHVLPRMGEWFPWWPVIVAILVSALVIGESRRKLLREWGWAWWPLLLAPVAFLLAYHFLIPSSFGARPYRDKSAYFFLPALCLALAALAAAVENMRRANRGLHASMCVLLAVGLLGQLPATARLLTTDLAPDFVQAGEGLVNDLPANASVLYMTPQVLWQWRLPFEAGQIPVYQMPTVLDTRLIAKRPRSSPTRGPVYVLVLAGECANSSYCDKPAPDWDPAVPGWKVLSEFDRFTLYGLTKAKTGRSAVLDALLSFSAAFGPRYGMLETFAAAGLLDIAGHTGRAHALIRRAFRELDADAREGYREFANRKGYNPFGPR